MSEKITVETLVAAPIEKVWECWTEPWHIVKWNNASDDWHSPTAENDLRVGGKFKTRMESKDGAAGFDFEGTYTAVEENSKIEYALGDGRAVSVTFAPEGDGVRVTETFDPEHENPIEMQRGGWQAILESFRRYVESR
jgi:uncharacterized protein YndB with AHSA1/START domain